MNEHRDDLKERMDERFDDSDRRFGEVDKRFDRFEASVNQRFDKADQAMKDGFSRVEDQFKELRIEIKGLHEDNKATNRVMLQGFLTFSGAIVASCAIVAGASAF